MSGQMVEVLIDFAAFGLVFWVILRFALFRLGNLGKLIIELNEGKGNIGVFFVLSEKTLVLVFRDDEPETRKLKLWEFRALKRSLFMERWKFEIFTSGNIVVGISPNVDEDDVREIGNFGNKLIECD